MTLQLGHFSAALVFALFASIVFAITHREGAREMLSYGLYCFAMFLGGVLVAGWAMWVFLRELLAEISFNPPLFPGSRTAFRPHASQQPPGSARPFPSETPNTPLVLKSRPQSKLTAP